MLALTLFLVLACLGLVVGGVIEQHRHYRNLYSIPIRVLVNGIRGKSTVTRLITAGLQAGGIRTVGKSTGSAARFIYPDGSEEEIPRLAANITEQIAVVRRAAEQQPQALVIECMAVAPELQWTMQHKLIQATIGVITNVRADHLQEMGPTLEDVALSQSTTIPRNGIVFTCEHDYFPILDGVARQRGSQAVQVTPDELAEVGMRRFPYMTFADNVALALAVCEYAGVPRRVALEGMIAARPDPGVISVHKIPLPAGHAVFINLLAANDPDSTVIATQAIRKQMQVPEPLVFLLNCRPDRLERSQQLGEMVPLRLRDEAARLVLVGTPTLPAQRAAVAHGYPLEQILTLGEECTGQVHQVFERIADSLADRAAPDGARFSVIGIGNIHGFGEEITAYLEELRGGPRSVAPQGQPGLAPSPLGT